MLHRLTHSPVVFLTFFFLLLASGDASFTSRAAPQAGPVKHGLTGNYYVSNYATHSDTKPTGYLQFAQVWQDSNDFNLPRPFGEPATVRVDPQVAFGQGKGFTTKLAGPAVIWWPTGFAIPAGWPSASPNEKPWNYLGAVIWKGYIHFPKAGTYYLATISNGPSAVYLNQARVALNGIYGGALASDAFSYAKEDIGDFVQNLYSGREDAALRANPGQMYVVPIPIAAPRDLPIEVAYNPMWPFTHQVSEPLGIDLFWVTPDSPRDANGKPIAKIVPADVLYSEPPGNIDRPAVRGANSMISSDFLYATVGANHVVTLAVRLADKDGHPVAGKRVWVSGVEDSGPADTFTQPEKPTDEKGMATAKVLAGGAHESTFFALDLTDLVDVTQVGHVTFKPEAGSRSFFPDTFAPYYDGHVPLIEPLPLRVGRPVTIKTPVLNRLDSAMEVTVTFEAHDWNIGASNWAEIGKVKGIRLRPGETREVSITWTPEKDSGDVCFRVSVSGHPISASLPSGALVAALLSATPPALAAPAGGDADFGSQTHNAGPVVEWWLTIDPDCCGPQGAFSRLPEAERSAGYQDGINGRPPRPRIYQMCDAYTDGYMAGDHERRHPEPKYEPPRLTAKTSWSSFNAGFRDRCNGLPHLPEHFGDNPKDYAAGWSQAHRDCPPPDQSFDPLGWYSVHAQELSERLGGCELRTSVAATSKASLAVEHSDLTAKLVEGQNRRFPAGSTQQAQICAKRLNNIELRPNEQTMVNESGLVAATFGLFDVVPWTNPALPQAQAAPATNKRQSALFVLFELASDFHSADETSRSRLLSMIDDRAFVAYDEGVLTYAAFIVQPDSNYRRLAPVGDAVAFAYTSALRSSYARFQGAQAAGDRDWAAKQLKASQEYAALLANALRVEAEQDDQDLAELQKSPFVARRSPPEQTAFVQQLKTAGLGPERVGLLRESGLTEARIAEFEKQQMQLPPEKVGISPAEMLKQIATSRRSLAAELTGFAQANAAFVGGASAQTFVLGNPHDRQENVDLFVRPISIPPDWKLSIVNAEQAEASGQAGKPGGDAPKFPVREVEAGKHYAVTLPAKAEVKVASVVIPVGEVGANTTARWAVEGYIGANDIGGQPVGGELIGGMVHEMNVPYIIADLKLPPVGSKEEEEELPAPSRLRLYVAVAVAGVLILGIFVFLLFWRRRRAKAVP